MAIFGTNATDGIDVGTANNFKLVSKFTLGQAGSVTLLSLYMRSAGGTNLMRGLVYADTAGQPTTLMAVGSEVTVADSGVFTWQDSTVSPAVVLSPGSYWLGFIASGTTLHYTYHTVTNNRKYKSEVYSATPSNPFGTPDGTDDFEVTVYATYDPVVGNLAPVIFGRGAC